MTIKAYFECAWKGPKVEVDSKGNVVSVSQDSVGECLFGENSPARRPVWLEASAPALQALLSTNSNNWLTLFRANRPH